MTHVMKNFNTSKYSYIAAREDLYSSYIEQTIAWFLFNGKNWTLPQELESCQ